MATTTPARTSMPTGRPTFETLAGLLVFARVRRKVEVDPGGESWASCSCALARVVVR